MEVDLSRHMGRPQAQKLLLYRAPTFLHSCVLETCSMVVSKWRNSYGSWIYRFLFKILGYLDDKSLDLRVVTESKVQLAAIFHLPSSRAIRAGLPCQHLLLVKFRLKQTKKITLVHMSVGTSVPTAWVCACLSAAWDCAHICLMRDSVHMSIPIAWQEARIFFWLDSVPICVESVRKSVPSAWHFAQVCLLRDSLRTSVESMCKSLPSGWNFAHVCMLRDSVRTSVESMRKYVPCARRAHICLLRGTEHISVLARGNVRTFVP